jgi:hypothetical protein
MKILLGLLSLLLFIGLGCLPSSNLDNDFEPVRGKTSAPADSQRVPWDQKIMTAISYDGVTFIPNDQWICDQCHVPDVVFKDGRIYLYYTGHTLGNRVDTTAVAISDNEGKTWTYKYVELEGNATSERFFNPDVILLEDGTFRLFFTGGQPVGIHYADGTDGITFTYRGPLFSPREDVATNSTTFKINDTWHFYALSEDGAHRIWHLTSADAMIFSVYAMTSFPNNGILSVPADGVWIADRFYLYLSAPDGTIGSMWSKNGFDWYPSGETNLAPREGESFVKDPVIVDLGDGRYLMFYVTSIS